VTSPWWAAFAPAETRIGCGSGKHQMRWADGRLQAVAHPDAEGELVLAALGGDTTPCLDLARAWGEHSDDLTALAIGPRSAADKLTFGAEALDEIEQARSAPASGRSAASAGSFTSQVIRHSTTLRATGGHSASFGSVRARRTGPLRPRPAIPRGMRMHWFGHEPDPARAELLWLLSLGAPFQLRLSGAVAHAWSAEGPRGRHRGQAGPALTAALTGRLAPPAGGWAGIDPAAVDATIHDGDGWGEIGEARTAGERRLRAQLPIGWLARVWAPGLAVVGGHLVVAVTHAAWPAAEVVALPGLGRKPVELSVRHDGREWSVAG
jgi:hypothetical protein